MSFEQVMHYLTPRSTITLLVIMRFAVLLIFWQRAGSVQSDERFLQISQNHHVAWGKEEEEDLEK